MKALRFDVFGRRVLIAASKNGWVTFYLGDDGKRRSAPDIVVPPDIPESGIAQYLDDICHEWATEHHPSVKQLDQVTTSYLNPRSKYSFRDYELLRAVVEFYE